MNFGNWLVVSFILFGIFIGSLVFVCVRQDLNLVSRNYYQEELKHQDKMEQLKNASSLAVKPVISLENDAVKIYFHDFNRIEKGELQLLRPSDERLDRKFKIETTRDTVQIFPLNGAERGLYRVRMKWTSQAKDFLLEDQIVR